MKKSGFLIVLILFISLTNVHSQETSAVDTGTIENLVVLAKVWGFLKYHHPRITTGDLDWDNELINILPSVLAVTGPSNRNTVLLNWVEKIGLPPACSPCAGPPANPHLLPDNDWINDTSLLGTDLSGYLLAVYRNRYAGGDQYYVSLVPNVANPVFNNESAYGNMEFPDQNYRLLALFRFWNFIQYWYPYRDIIGASWEDVLRDFIPVFMAAEPRDEYALALVRLLARVNDTHTNLWNGYISVIPPTGNCYLPVYIRFIEDQTTVSGFAHDSLGPASGLRIGDVIKEIDGVPAAQLIAERSPYYAASNQPTRLRDIARFMTRGTCESVGLKIQRGPNELNLEVERIPQADFNLLPYATQTHDLPGATFQWLDQDVAYIKLSTITNANVPTYMQMVQEARGLIIDIRNYPNEFVIYNLGGYLVNQTTDFATFTHMDLSNPGASIWGKTVAQQPKLPHFTGKAVVLIDEITQSQAEFTTMGFQADPNTVVVGSTTAGADGNVSEVVFPGGFSGYITGLGVFYPDKTPTQRTGITPDVFVMPTIEGIRSGRDELLEQGLREILGSDFSAFDGDGDGAPNVEDDLPNNPDETVDTDKDGIGNNSDTDDDNDGMPDWWEIANHLDPLLDDADLDDDKDGFSNIKEYIEGTDPQDPRSHPSRALPWLLLLLGDD